MEQRGKIMREHVKLNMLNAEQQQHEHAHDVTKPLLLGRGGGGGGVHDDGCGQEVDITYHIDPVVCVCVLYIKYNSSLELDVLCVKGLNITLTF